MARDLGALGEIEVMLISHKHKFIYLHVPRTGGTSVVQLLKSCTDAKIVPELYHRPVLEVRGAYPVYFKDYFTFCTVRNPWDMYASLYSYICGNPSHDHHEEVKAVDFNIFIDRLESYSFFPTVLARNYYADEFGEFILDGVTTTEALGLSLIHVLNAVGVDVSKLMMPKVNTSSYLSDRVGCYNEKSIAKIAELCALDIETFHYRFGTNACCYSLGRVP